MLSESGRRKGGERARRVGMEKRVKGKTEGGSEGGRSERKGRRVRVEGEVADEAGESMEWHTRMTPACVTSAARHRRRSFLTSTSLTSITNNTNTATGNWSKPRKNAFNNENIRLTLHSASTTHVHGRGLEGNVTTSPRPLPSGGTDSLPPQTPHHSKESVTSSPFPSSPTRRWKRLPGLLRCRSRGSRSTRPTTQN